MGLATLNRLNPKSEPKSSLSLSTLSPSFLRFELSTAKGITWWKGLKAGFRVAHAGPVLDLGYRLAGFVV